MAAFNAEPSFTIYPVGAIKRSEDKTYIEVFPKYREGLQDLDEFSHVTVVYWFDRNDTPDERNTLLTKRKSQGKNVGVFATHSPVRPNLIALSYCRIQSIEENRLYIDAIDAFDDSPVIDLKCFIPYTCGKKDEEFILPEWVKELIKSEKE